MKQPYVGSISSPSTPPLEWPLVTHDGVIWQVAPVYVAPVARVDLGPLLAEYDCELPTPGLVDAIWRAADLRLNPYELVRTPSTWQNMASADAFADQRERIEHAVFARAFTLLAGSHKDFVRTEDGRTDLYGWHTLQGVPIQPPKTGHNAMYLDYSQGARLVRRVGQLVTQDGSVA